MATTVFPQTDDSVTTAAWSSMIAAVDRGQADPLANSSDTAHDSARLSFGGLVTATSTGIGDWQTIATLPVDEGMAFEGTLNADVLRVDNGGAGSDPLAVRITAPSGVTVYGVTFHQGDFTAASTQFSPIKVSGATSNVSSINSGVFTSAAIAFYLVVIGDAGGGNVTVEFSKNTDSDADDFTVANARAMLSRIW